MAVSTSVVAEVVRRVVGEFQSEWRDSRVTDPVFPVHPFHVTVSRCLPQIWLTSFPPCRRRSGRVLAFGDGTESFTMLDTHEQEHIDARRIPAVGSTRQVPAVVPRFRRHVPAMGFYDSSTSNCDCTSDASSQKRIFPEGTWLTLPR